MDGEMWEMLLRTQSPMTQILFGGTHTIGRYEPLIAVEQNWLMMAPGGRSQQPISWERLPWFPLLEISLNSRPRTAGTMSPALLGTICGSMVHQETCSTNGTNQLTYAAREPVQSLHLL